MRVLRGAPGQKDLNQKIAKVLGDATEIAHHYEFSRTPLTKERFWAEFHNADTKEDFITYMEDKGAEAYARGVFGMSRKIQIDRVVSKLRAYTGGQLTFAEINRAKMEAFDAWHAKQLEANGFDGYAERKKTMKLIKQFLDQARSDGKKCVDAFIGYVFPVTSPDIQFLTREELDKLLNLYHNPDLVHVWIDAQVHEVGQNEGQRKQYKEAAYKRIHRTLRWYLFQVTTGSRYERLKNADWREVVDGYLIFKPNKTSKSSGAEVCMKITDFMWELMGAKKKQGKIFPNIINNARYNKNLKELAKCAGIDKPIKSHSGRHTYATQSLIAGMPLPVLQDLMGLKKISTLMVYVHVVDGHRDEQHMQAWGDFGKV